MEHKFFYSSFCLRGKWLFLQLKITERVGEYRRQATLPETAPDPIQIGYLNKPSDGKEKHAFPAKPVHEKLKTFLHQLEISDQQYF